MGNRSEVTMRSGHSSDGAANAEAEGNRMRSASADDGAFGVGTRLSAMTGEQMFNDGVGFFSGLAAQLSVFVDGYVSRHAQAAGLREGRDQDALELIEFFTHGAPNFTTAGQAGKGTFVLFTATVESKGSKWRGRGWAKKNEEEAAGED